MDVDRYEHGVPSWVDIGTSDIPGAIAFYSGLFGWHAEPGPPEAGGYAVAELRNRPVAGIGPQQSPGPPYWTTYVNVDDAAAIPALVEANGGQVLARPMDVMEQGKMAVFMDPQGAAFSVWQPGLHPGAGVVNEPGSYSWSELVTTDPAGAIAFYGAVFGWGAQTQGEGPGAYTEWKIGDRSVGGMMAKPPTMPAEVPSHWGVYFTVSDTAAAVAKVEELGGSLIVPPMEIEPGIFAVVRDPQGGMFNVMTLRAGP